jgi:hypothetical protein
MAHHHKSNQAVEGSPETGHGRGMPRRLDEKTAGELEERTAEDRREMGLPADPGDESGEVDEGAQ